MPINKESPFGQFLIGETSALCDQVGLEIVKEINGASIEDSSDLEGARGRAGAGETGDTRLLQFSPT